MIATYYKTLRRKSFAIYDQINTVTLALPFIVTALLEQGMLT